MGKLLVFLIIISGILVFAYYFHQEILDSLRSFMERKEEAKKVVPEERKLVTLFFSDADGEYLIGEKREISKRGRVEEEAEEALHELIKGSKGRLTRTVPVQTKLLALKIDEQGIAKVSFNQALSKEHPGGSSAEMMTIYSIVNSLTLNFPQIKRVQILINGKVVESIAGHISLRQPISSNPKMVKKIGKR
ncbi:MAG: GerMN domain-containing protein [Thermodesulfobacteriota bacterium]